MRNKLLAFPLLSGIVLILYAWFLSYPLRLDSSTDFIFNHISYFYWIGLALTLSSLYLIATVSQNHKVRWLAIVGIVTAMYSLSYFYYFLPGSDSHYFRGLTEYALSTDKLDPSAPAHSYYQWPVTFVLSKVLYTLGVDVRLLQFVLYGVIGMLFGTCIYSISSKFSRGGALLAVISFFIIMRYYLNYQFVPFSLAFGLLLILFLLIEHEIKNRNVFLVVTLMFIGITFMHAFVPVLFISYVFLKYLFSRERVYLRILLLTLTLYSAVLLFQANNIFLPYAVAKLSKFHSSEYVTFSEGLIVGSVNPIDSIAQLFSRAVLIVSVAISGLGLLVIILKRKLRQNDYVIFVSGAAYALLGVALPILGTRAFALIAISAGLGATYFLRGRLKVPYEILFLILIVLTVFVPIHSSFVGTVSQVQFQSQRDYECAGFLLSHYDWNGAGIVLSDIRTINYIETKSSSPTLKFESDFSPGFPRNMREYVCIMYTIGLEKSVRASNSSQLIFDQLQLKNRVYDSGSSQILTEP